MLCVGCSKPSVNCAQCSDSKASEATSVADGMALLVTTGSKSFRSKSCPWPMLLDVYSSLPSADVPSGTRAFASSPPPPQLSAQLASAWPTGSQRGLFTGLAMWPSSLYWSPSASWVWRPKRGAASPIFACAGGSLAPRAACQELPAHLGALPRHVACRLPNERWG